MKVENMRSSRGNKVANQFIITDCHPGALFPIILTGPLDLSMDYNIFFREFNLTETAHNCRRNLTIFIVKFSGKGDWRFGKSVGNE